SQVCRVSRPFGDRRRQGTARRGAGRPAGPWARRDPHDQPRGAAGGDLSRGRPRSAPPGPEFAGAAPLAVGAGRSAPLRPQLPPAPAGQAAVSFGPGRDRRGWAQEKEDSLAAFRLGEAAAGGEPRGDPGRARDPRGRGRAHLPRGEKGRMRRLMPGRALLAALVFFIAINAALSPAAEGVSLASIGYTMLRWLDRAEITHHNLSVEVDPLALSARFADEVTFISRGSRHLHILLSADAVLERVTDASGEERSFLRVLGWGGMPFVLYRVEAPETGHGEPFVLRFEWRITPESVQHFNPFVALHFFYLGHAALWHPHSPTEEFFTAEIAVTVPQGYTALADGELVLVEEAPGARERFHFRTAAPVGRSEERRVGKGGRPGGAQAYERKK